MSRKINCLKSTVRDMKRHTNDKIDNRIFLLIKRQCYDKLLTLYYVTIQLYYSTYRTMKKFI